jgi:signal transduction histidine kinase/CheY-like chemotaxis protein
MLNSSKGISYAKSLIEANLNPIVIIDKNGRITDMNEVFVQITSESRAMLMGSPYDHYFTNAQKAKTACRHIFEKGFINDCKLTMSSPIEKDTLFSGFVYKNEQGKVMGAVISGRDISKQKQIENQLREAKTIAEKAILTEKKATIAAKAATKLANDAVKSKQQFLSNMSHEIRTPMNAIIGFTKVVLKTDLTAKQKEYLTAIKLSGDSLIVLINDILDLAKVDAGKMVFEKIPFKLSLSVNAMLHLFETKIQEKNLKLIIDYDEKIPEILIGDPVRLHQIILNLVSNAVKFTNQGSITVGVHLFKEDVDSVTIEFKVTDTGIGIAPDKIKSIFENFQQASIGTSRLYGGTGLGLAIVKQLVKGQKGTINVKSNFDNGTEFSFVLKFMKTDINTVLEPEIVELNADVKDTRILVVEDMELNQLLMKTLLDDFGFECDITANGKLAIEKLKTKPYDIVLMDLQMPEMNGFEATKYIRKTMHSKIPIIALTADVTTVDVEKCKAAGMNDYIAKPVDERLLYSKLISYSKKPIAIITHKEGEKGTQDKIRYVDLNYLMKLTKANPALMAEMINAYLSQTPPLVDIMNKSLKDKDWKSLQSAVHKMVPSFSIMGMNPEIEIVAKKIQEYAYSIEISNEINHLVQKLETVCKQSCKELEQELNKLKVIT